MVNSVEKNICNAKEWEEKNLSYFQIFKGYNAMEDSRESAPFHSSNSIINKRKPHSLTE